MVGREFKLLVKAIKAKYNNKPLIAHLMGFNNTSVLDCWVRMGNVPKIHRVKFNKIIKRVK